MKNSPKLEYQGELTAEQALSVLPDFTTIRKDEAEEFVRALRDGLKKHDYNGFLNRLRTSFSQFLYDEFPELEQHYRDHLFLVATLLSDLDGFSYDFSQRDMVVFRYFGTFIIFNLRGSAEAAIEKFDGRYGEIAAGPVDNLVGVSFSAFDRTIDRWVSSIRN